MAVQDTLDYEDLVMDYLSGEGVIGSEQEAYDAGIIDELGWLPNAYTGSSSAINGITCRCCGTPGLMWGKVGGKWRLFGGSGLHQCPVNPLREDT